MVLQAKLGLRLELLLGCRLQPNRLAEPRSPCKPLFPWGLLLLPHSPQCFPKQDSTRYQLWIVTAQRAAFGSNTDLIAVSFRRTHDNMSCPRLIPFQCTTHFGMYWQRPRRAAPARLTDSTRCFPPLRQGDSPPRNHSPHLHFPDARQGFAAARPGAFRWSPKIFPRCGFPSRRAWTPTRSPGSPR